MKKKTIIKQLAAVGLALTVCLTSPAAVANATEIQQPAQTDAPAQTPQEQMVRSVYTNELIPASQANLRPIAVMMPTDKACQPSYGISNAKVLYEIMEEGNISRQLAIIDNWQGLERIGNVRSCRDYYIPVATEWDPILIHFGGVYYMQDKITAPDINNLSGTYEYGTGGDRPGAGYFYRTTDRKAPHNAYISASGITKACEKLGYSLTIRQEYYNTSHFLFANGVNTLEQYPGAVPGNVVDLSQIFSYTKSYFTYNAADGLYYKNIHGKAQTDGLTGQQLSFSNIIIQNTHWSKRDEKGYLAFQNIDSTRDGWYFTKGRGIHITWKKTSNYGPTKYYDDNGNEIQINEGKTYIAIAQEGKPVLYS